MGENAIKSAMDKLTVLYDGQCHLCYREIMHYARKDSRQLLNLVDISSHSFNATDYGLQEEDVNLHMHAIDHQGIVFKGLDSFIEIWKRIPQFKFLIPIFNQRQLRPIWNRGYHLFAKHIRPRLPKRNCEDNTCKI